jgi:hypothetical protein
MDLMKLLKAKTEQLLSTQRPNASMLTEEILKDLKSQFDLFLKDVSHLEEFRTKNPLDGVKAVSGDLLLEDSFGVVGKNPYLFLRIPGRPGLLLEPVDEEKLVLVSATEARPYQRQWNGEMSNQTVFVRQPHPIATFQVIDCDAVRLVGDSKTLFGAQFFESLVEMLIMRIHQASEK